MAPGQDDKGPVFQGRVRWRRAWGNDEECRGRENYLQGPAITITFLMMKSTAVLNEGVENRRISLV